MGKVVCDRQVNRNAGIVFENFAIFRSTKLKILFKDKNKNMTDTKLSPMLIKIKFSVLLTEKLQNFQKNSSISVDLTITYNFHYDSKTPLFYSKKSTVF